MDLDVDFGMRVKVCFPPIFNSQLAFGFCEEKINVIADAGFVYQQMSLQTLISL